MRYLLAAAQLLLITLFAVPSAHARDDLIRIASTSNQDIETNGAYVFAHTLNEELEAAGFEVRFYPNSSLGADAQRTELVELGLVHVNISGTQVLGDWSPLFSAMGLSFLFDDYDHFERFLHETDFIDAVNEELEGSNLRLMEVAYLGGMSGVFNTRHPIHSLDDMRPLRMRAMGSGDLSLLGSWGLSGTQVAWEEVSQALQTGIADGYFNPPLVPVLFGHQRQIRYFTRLRLQPSARYVLVPDNWYRSLPDDRRAALDAALLAARRANQEWTQRMIAEEQRILEENGITVTDITDEARGEFVELSRARYETLHDPEVIARLMEFIEEARATQ